MTLGFEPNDGVVEVTKISHRENAVELSWLSAVE